MIKREYTWLILLGMVPGFWLFGPALATNGSFAYRDAGHYYRPLYEYVNQEWIAGRVPLWNPWENCGQPLAADPTAAVFYPGKLLYLAPLLPGQRFTLYVVAHWLLAGAGAFFLARAWQATPWAALCAALSYACSGSVLFQYCNVIFLVGAAWLPFVIWAAHLLATNSSWRAAIGLALSLSLMVLGGDIQMAYHAVMLMGLYTFILWRSQGCSAPAGATNALANGDTKLGRILYSISLFGGTLLLAGALAAVQLLPTWEYGSRTDRAYYNAPRSIYEGFDAGLWLAEPPQGTHHAAIYDFSVGPWRLMEFVWPNVSGRNFPIQRRWLDRFPAEDRTWNPSLYFGLLPLLLAGLSFRLRHAGVTQKFASWLVCLALLASLGRFGFGWLARELAHDLAGVDPTSMAIGQPVGGFFWFLVTFLPGYAMFRYPAKWLVVAALGCSLLAARGWDDCFTAKRHSLLARFLKITGGLSGALFVVAGVARFAFPSWMSGVPADECFGPFDAAGAQRDVLVSFAHTAAVSGLVLWLLRRAGSRVSAWQPVLFAMVAVELCLAQQWMLPTVADDELHSEFTSSRISPAENSGVFAFTRYYRAADDGFMPAEFAETSSPHRLREVVAWNQATLFPKHHLGLGVALVETPGLAMSADYEAFLEVARRHGVARQQGEVEPDAKVLDLCGVRYFIRPHHFPYPGTELRRVFPINNHAVLLENSSRPPTIFLAPRAVHVPALATRNRNMLLARTESLLYPQGQFLDFSKTVILEGNEPSFASLPGAAEFEAEPAPELSPGVLHWQPGAISIRARLASPGYLFVGEGYDPHWRARVVTNQQAPTEVAPWRANRAFMAWLLPAGESRVELRYQPASFTWGACVSCLSWIAVLGWFLGTLLVSICRRRATSK